MMATNLNISRIHLNSIIGLSVASILWASNAYAAGLEKLTVRYGPIPEPQLVAHHKKWFDEELGIPVKWVTMNGGANALAAMQSGSLDIACGVGAPPIAAALAQGVPIRIFWIQDNAPESLVVNPAKVRSVAELRGKRIAAVSGSTMYFALVVALKAENLTTRDVDIVDLPNNETVAAYHRGNIDGAILSHPQVDSLIESGAKEIMSPVDRAQKYGYPLFDACIVLDTFAAAHPDVLEKWVRVEDKANRYVRANLDDALQTIASALNIDKSKARAGLEVAVQPSAREQLDPKWMGKPGSTGSGIARAIQITAQFQKDLGRIPTMPNNIDAAVDSSAISKVAEGK
jgi:taurine transport system substrate-binding protein